MQGLDFMPQKARELYCNLSFSQVFKYTLLNSLQLIIMHVCVSICREHFCQLYQNEYINYDLSSSPIILKTLQILKKSN